MLGVLHGDVGEGERRVVRIAGVPLTVTVQVVLIGIGDGGAIVGGIADSVAVRVATAADRTHPRLADVGQRAGDARPAAAHRAVDHRVPRALAGERIAARARLALRRGTADHRVGADAAAGVAGIAQRARVAVVAGGPIGSVRCRTRTGHGIAGSRGRALIDRRADGRLLRRVRAVPGPRVARADEMARVDGRALHLILADTDAALAGIGQRAEIAVVTSDAVRCRRVRA
jgi:hypothetical protein